MTTTHKHYSEVKYSRFDRKVTCGGSKAHKAALKAYNRASRRASKLALKEGGAV